MAEKLLRKKELVDATGVAKSTVADWINEFDSFIPTIRSGNTLLYKPEALEVLATIRDLREQGFSKQEIAGILPSKGFAITVAEAEKSHNELISQVNVRENLMSVLQQMGAAIELSSKQQAVIIEQQKQILEQSERLNEQQQQIQDMVEHQKHMESQIEVLQQQQIELMQRQEDTQKRSFWQRIFTK